MKKISMIENAILAKNQRAVTKKDIIRYLKHKHSYVRGMDRWTKEKLMRAGEYASNTVSELRTKSGELGLKKYRVKKGEMVRKIIEVEPVEEAIDLTILDDLLAELEEITIDIPIPDQPAPEPPISKELQEAFDHLERLMAIPPPPPVELLRESRPLYESIQERIEEMEYAKELRENQAEFINQLVRFNNGSINEIPEIDYPSLGGLNAVIDMISNYVFNRRVIITYDDAGVEKGLTLTQNAINKIKSAITGLETVQEIENTYQAITLVITNTPYINIKGVRQVQNTNRKMGGAFFKYTCILPVDLSRLGIYNEVKYDNYKSNCFYKALEEAGLNKTKLKILRSMITGHTVAMTSINKIVQHLKICIRIQSDKEGSERQRYQTFGKEYEEVFNICLLDDHYFAKINIPIAFYAVKNYQQIKDKKNWMFIDKKSGDRYKRNYKASVDSYKLVKYLLNNKNKCLSAITNTDEIYRTPLYKLSKTDDLNIVISEECCKPFNFAKHKYNLDLDYSVLDKEELKENMDNPNIVFQKVGKTTQSFNIIFFDFETESLDNTHLPYCCCYYDPSTKEYKSFRGRDCGEKMLESIPYDYVCLYAHNCGYDFRFLYKYLTIQKYIRKGRSLVNSMAKYGNKRIMLRDTYKMISVKLSKFGDMFKLDTEKEVMPYKLYNGDILEKPVRLIEDALAVLEKDQHPRFIDNINRWNLKVGEKMFNALNYSVKYCEMDCKVLSDGFSTFRKWIYEITKLNINNYLSQASVADAYLKKEGVYENVSAISGHLRSFIQKCVVGGRCMLAENKKQEVKGQKINDFDACSLYPSAMKRLGEYGGFLKGVPNELQENQKNIEFLNTVDGYFVLIKIKSVGIKRKFPLLSFVNENGVRIFSNDIVGKEIYVDKFTLEDAINFQKVGFEILSGVYFNQGRNSKVKDIITHLYNTRRKEKANKNPIQSSYKLLMNSSYGKSILKPIETDDIIVNSEEDYHKVLNRKFYYINEITKLTNEKYHIKLNKGINNHYNYAQVGTEILSMSKRIMNEVICLAEDNGIDIYYQDTDSMHILDDKVSILGDLFKTKYGRELIGNDMGQFHCDFEMGDASDIVSTYFIALGKKVYLDVLEGKDKNGNKVQGYHIRCKGVSDKAIIYQAEEMKMSIVELYQYMYEGNEVKFDLTLGGLSKIFDYKADFTVKYTDDFTRTLKFD